MNKRAEHWHLQRRRLEAAKHHVDDLTGTLDKLRTRLAAVRAEVAAPIEKMDGRIDAAQKDVDRLRWFVGRLQAEHEDKFTTAGATVDDLAEQLAGLTQVQCRQWIIGLLRRVDEGRRSDGDFDLVLELVAGAVVTRLAVGKWESSLIHRQYHGGNNGG